MPNLTPLRLQTNSTEDPYRTTQYALTITETHQLERITSEKLVIFDKEHKAHKMRSLSSSLNKIGTDDYKLSKSPVVVKCQVCSYEGLTNVRIDYGSLCLMITKNILKSLLTLLFLGLILVYIIVMMTAICLKDLYICPDGWISEECCNCLDYHKSSPLEDKWFNCDFTGKTVRKIHSCHRCKSMIGYSQPPQPSHPAT